MNDAYSYAAGIDVGTENVRVVLLSGDREGKYAVKGYGEMPNAGMRKGVVANLAGPSERVNKLLGEVERMSGVEINHAMVSINGTQMLSTKGEGMITLPEGHLIDEDDLLRVEDAAVAGRVPANRQILKIVPLEYILDDQNGIKDPLGMTGARLMVKVLVLSTLLPNYENLNKAMQAAQVGVMGTLPSVVAGAKAVLSEKQKESGVAVVDLGATTTGVAVYEEGELQYVGVVPMGSENITKDLAIMLEVDMEMAEEIKRRFVTGDFGASEKEIVMKKGREELNFKRKLVEEIAKARLKEIFEGVKRELVRAGYDRRLPEGVVLVGGGAKMKDIEIFAKKVLEAATRVMVPMGLSGVASEVEKPEYAAAVGLAISVAEEDFLRGVKNRQAVSKKAEGGKMGWLKNFLSKF